MAARQGLRGTMDGSLRTWVQSTALTQTWVQGKTFVLFVLEGYRYSFQGAAFES